MPNPLPPASYSSSALVSTDTTRPSIANANTPNATAPGRVANTGHLATSGRVRRHRAMRHEARARAPSRQPVVKLTAEETRALELCAGRLHESWHQFISQVVANARFQQPQPATIAQLAARIEHLAKEAEHVAKSSSIPELIGHSFFVHHLSQPGSLQPLLPEVMAWMKLHVDIIERTDVERGTYTELGGAQASHYLRDIEKAMSGTLDQAMCNPVLAKLLNTLQRQSLRISTLANACLKGTPIR